MTRHSARSALLAVTLIFIPTGHALAQDDGSGDLLGFSTSFVADQVWPIHEPVPEEPFANNFLTGGSLAGGTYSLSPLPAGVTFDSMTRRLSGIPTTLSDPTPATLSGTDSDGTEVELMFMISVQNPLRFTSNVVADQVWRVNEPVEEQPFMANSLIGGSGGGYTYALSPVPPGVTFDSMTRRLSGTPTGIRNPRPTTLTGADSDGTEVELMFMVSIVENRVRVTVTANGMSGTAFTFPEDVGTIRLAVTAELLPAGSTRRGTVSPVMIMAADGFGLSAPALRPDDYLRETPVAGNPALEIPEGVMSRTWMYDLEIVADSVVEFNEMLLFVVNVGGLRESQSQWIITITDPRTANIELTLSPSIIYEDSGSTLGGVTPVVATVRSLTTLARAVDISLSAAGGTAEDTEFSVARTDSRPLDEFGELDQRVLSITRELTITPVMDTVSEGDETVILTASGTGDDTGITAMATLTIRDGVQPDNAPVLSGSINDQRYLTIAAIEPVTLPIATGGNGPLRYSIDPELPAGLSFDAGRRIISGRPEAGLEPGDSYTYIAADTDSNTANSDTATLGFIITVIPNRPAMFDGQLSGRVVKGATNNEATGTLTINDPDGANRVVPVSGNEGDYGDFTITPTGDWTYTLQNNRPATVALTAAAVVMDSFTVTAADDRDTPATTEVVITVVGGVPTIGGMTSGTVMADEVGADGMLTVSGRLMIEPPGGDDTFVPQTRSDGMYGFFSLEADGDWTYELDPARYRMLGDEEVSDTFTAMAVADGIDDQVITITINGTDDPPIADAGENQKLVAVAGLMVTLDGSASSSPEPASNPESPMVLTYQWVQTGGTTVVLSDDGAAEVVTFTVPDVNVPTTLIFELTVTDTTPAMQTNTDTVEIMLRPAVTISGVNTGAVTEDGELTTGGTLTVNRPGGGDTTFMPQSNTDGEYGLFSIASDGAWTYTLGGNPGNEEALRTLTGDAAPTDPFTVMARTDSSVTQVVTITVRSVDNPPVAAAMINGATGTSASVDRGATVTLDGSASTDPEGGALSYQWTQPPQQTVTFTPPDGAAAVVTFTAPQERTTMSFTLSVTDTAMNNRQTTVTVQVGRENPGRVLKRSLAAFGRAFATSAVDIISDQLITHGENRFTLNGRTLGLGHDAVPPLFEEQPAQASTARRAAFAGAGLDLWADDNPEADYMTTRDLLAQSSFHYTPGANDEAPDTPGFRSVWGRVAHGNYEGRPDDNFTLDGDLSAAYLGMDYRVDELRRAGVAISRSESGVDYNGGGDGNDGTMDAQMNSILPYMRCTLRDDLAVWGLLGYGLGDAQLRNGTATGIETNIEMQLVAAGLRGTLLPLERTDMAWKASVFAVKIESDEEENLPAVDAASQHLRIALEGRVPEQAPAWGLYTPGWELGLRWDDGDTENGIGVDLGWSLLYENPNGGMQVQARGRYLAVHEERDYKEWSASLEARMDPGARGQGLALTLTPDWKRRENSQRVGLDFSNLIGGNKRTTHDLRLELYGERSENESTGTGYGLGLSGSLRF